MITAIEKEIVLRRNYIDEKVNTIYFGGGTPSLLKKDELERIFQALRVQFDFDSSAEITLEANPDDIDNNSLESWKAMGVNRLSIGIQTFNEDILHYLNRIHTAEEAITSVEKARKHGFENFNIDLIYALPSSDHSNFLNDLKIALELRPYHISAYNLTIEPKTVFGSWLQKGKITEMSDDFAAEQYELLCETLKKANYVHYEVSNFSLPRYQSRHNTSYWKGTCYLGIGPGAHSYNGVSRQINKSNNPLYIKALSEDKVPSITEKLGQEEKINEYLLTGLRTCWGIDTDYLKEKYSYRFSPKQHDIVEHLLKNGMATINNSVLTLTERGFLLADQIALELSL